jgi:hypothetical protein
LPAATLVVASRTLPLDQSLLDSVPPSIEHPPRS